MFPEIQERIREELSTHRYSRTAALTVFAIHKPRIFEEGLAANGSSIGEYTDPAYIQKRRQAGRETGFVNLAFTEQMKRDYLPSDDGKAGFGFSDDEQKAKADFNEKRYGKPIFELSQEEEDLFVDTFEKLLFGDEE